LASADAVLLDREEMLLDDAHFSYRRNMTMNEKVSPGRPGPATLYRPAGL
jgi:hypothetical protein